MYCKIEIIYSSFTMEIFEKNRQIWLKKNLPYQFHNDYTAPGNKIKNGSSQAKQKDQQRYLNILSRYIIIKYFISLIDIYTINN